MMPSSYSHPLFDGFGDIFIPLGQPLPGEPREIFGRGGTVVRRIQRNEGSVADGRAVGLQIEHGLLDFVGDDPGIGYRFGHIGKELRHLVPRLHVKLVRAEFHPLGVGQRLFRLNAEEDILRLPILFGDVVHVVGGDQADVQLPRDPDELEE